MDCSCAFVLEAKEPFYSSLVSSAPKVIELEGEPTKNDNPAHPTNVKEVGSVKDNRKGKRVTSSQVSTGFYTKAFVQRTATPATTVVESPTTTPFTLAPDLDLALSHCGVALPSVPCKRKAIAPDTSATSFEKSSSLSLIENVDMGELIEDLMRTKVTPPTYRCIQKFLIKVCMSFLCFIHSFLRVQHLFFCY